MRLLQCDSSREHYFYLRQRVPLLCHFLWKQSISFCRHKAWLLWQCLHAVLPCGFEFRAAFRREFECLASCNSLREAQPPLLELQLGFLSCLSFLNEGNSCVFSQGILNFSNHLLLSHKHRQVKLKLNTALMSRNFSPDLWDNISCVRSCFVSCVILNCCKSREGSSVVYEARYSLWLCKRIGFWGGVLVAPAPYWLQELVIWLPIGKKVLVPLLCIYWFCNIFICSDLLASTRKPKFFIIILADNSTGKTCKHLQHTFRSSASPFLPKQLPSSKQNTPFHQPALWNWVQVGMCYIQMNY